MSIGVKGKGRGLFGEDYCRKCITPRAIFQDGLCLPHWEKNDRKKISLKEKRRSSVRKGLCVTCREPSRKGRKTCSRCSDMQAKNTKNWLKKHPDRAKRVRAVPAGKCSVCRQRKPRPKLKTCLKCAKYWKKYRAERLAAAKEK